MITVYKYEIPHIFLGTYKEFDINMPFGANLMKVMVNDRQPSLYAEVETMANPRKRNFCLVIEKEYEIKTQYCINFIDTFTENNIVYHLFEILN